MTRIMDEVFGVLYAYCSSYYPDVELDFWIGNIIDIMSPETSHFICNES